MFEFSFVALSNLVLAGLTIYAVWKFVGAVIVELYNVTVLETEPTVDNLATLLRWKWAVAAFIVLITLMFNPLDLSISEQAQRHNAQQNAVTEKKYDDLPERVTVDPRRNLDESGEEFTDFIDRKSAENAEKQNVEN